MKHGLNKSRFKLIFLQSKAKQYMRVTYSTAILDAILRIYIWFIGNKWSWEKSLI